MTFNYAINHTLPNSEAMLRLIDLLENVLETSEYDYQGSYVDERIDYIEVVDARGERHIIDNENIGIERLEDFHAQRDEQYAAGLRG